MTPPRACVEAVRTGLKADALGCLCWVNPDIPLPCDACCALVATAVLAAFVEGEPSPDARYRAEPLLGNRWAVTTHGVMLDICLSAEQARAVAAVLNYLEAARG